MTAPGADFPPPRGRLLLMVATMTQPSDPHERATAKPVHIPTVLAVGCSDALLARCWEALSGLGVMVRDCEPALAATLAAARQPLAIVVSTEVYALDAGELDALARDVRATLLCVDEGAGGRELAEALAGAVRAASRRRGERSSSGRYSLLPGELLAAADSFALSEPPPTSHVRASSPLLDDLEDELLAVLR
jgi:hypothetical protein